MRGPTDLVDAGKLTPNKTRDHAIHRIPTIAADLARLIHETGPDAIIIEITSGKVGKRHQGNGAGLAIYGMAVGYLWHVCEAMKPGNVATVEENTWTRGVPKDKRANYITSAFRGYDRTKDKGGDVADAIGLGRWYLMQMGVVR